LKQPWAGIGERRWRNNLGKKENKKLFVCYADFLREEVQTNSLKNLRNRRNLRMIFSSPTKV